MVASAHFSSQSFHSDTILYYYHWVDTSASTLLVPDGLNRPF